MSNNPSQSLNLGGQPQAYGDSFSALNLFHGADAWITFGPNGEEIRNQVPVDEQGWLTDLPLVNGQPQTVFANIFYTKIIPAGDYIVEWEGEGSLSTYSNMESLGANKFRINFEGSSPTNESGITLFIESTDPNNTGNYIRDIKIYKEEYSDLVAMGENFDPKWFDAIDDFRVLRTHDWQGTNFSKVTNPTTNDFTSDQAFWVRDGRGMPIELLVDVANESRSDLWINIPHMATEEYMREVAQYVKDNLANDLRVYVEYTNEYWTTIFDQHPYLNARGAELFGNVPFANAQAYGARASEMTQIFKQVFGAEQSRLFPTVTLDDTAFNTAEAMTMLTTPAYVAQGGISPLDAGIKFLATDGYLSWFNTDPATDEMVDRWISEADGGFASARDFLLNQLNNQLVPNWEAGRALADQLGLNFGVYEGGALLINGLDPLGGNPVYTNFNERFQISPEMREVYEAELAAWQAVGSGPFSWYSDVGRWGPWGDYGLWNAPNFEPELRTEAIIDANQNVDPWWSGDTRTAPTFDNGRYAAGTTLADVMNGTTLADRLYGLSGNDRVFGKAGADQLHGGLGSDRLYGGLGADKHIGGDGTGIDYARYDDANYGNLTIRLDGGANVGAAAVGDTYTGIEGLFAGSGNDTVIGNSAANYLFGGGGKDTINGLGGNDSLHGVDGTDTLIGGDGSDRLYGGLGADRHIGGNGPGIDYARYDDANYGDLTIRLDGGANIGAAAVGDTYVGIEGLIAGSGNDTVIGNNADNRLFGIGGNDTINGLGGNDSLYGVNGTDTLIGGDGSDRLYGGLGADRHIGGDGPGIDFARYDDANYGNLTISLLAPVTNTGAAAGDTYIGIEGLAGGLGNDVVTGNGATNYLFGGGGNDLIDGLGGGDVLNGGLGADRFRFSTALGAGNIDTVQTFVTGADDLLLAKSIFTAIGASLTADEFRIGAAVDGNDFILYNSATGALTYDTNGNGAGGITQFATLSAGLALTVGDFIMV